MHPWRERLSRWLTPVARRTPLSANAVTLLALALNLVGAWLLAVGGRRPALFLLASVFIAVAGFADALDGIVARLQYRGSRFGDFVAHICDRIAGTGLG